MRERERSGVEWTDQPAGLKNERRGEEGRTSLGSQGRERRSLSFSLLGLGSYWEQRGEGENKGGHDGG